MSDRSDEEINRLATAIAREILVKAGIDPDKLVDVQKDLAFLRSLREMYSDTARHGLKAIVATFIVGLCALIWSSIKTGKMP